MRRFAVILLLSACSQEPAGTGDEGDAAASPGAAAAGNLSASPAQLEQRVDRAMTAVLQDPEGARYRNVRAGLAGTICGEVDPKKKGGGHTGFRPFLVTPEGIARVAASSRITFDDATDPFPDFYIRWCASAEELKQLEPELRRAIAGSGGETPLPGALPPEPVPDPLAGDPGSQPPPSPPSAPGEKAESRPADVDSFLNSVKRKPPPRE